MFRPLYLFALIFVLPVFASEQGPLVARIVDDDVDRMPLNTAVPNYPRKARRDRVEGEVQVCFEIDRQGRTRRVAIRHSTNRAFEKVSIQAVRDSTFRPLKEDQPLQSMKGCRTFIFSLEAHEDEQELK